MTTTLFGPLAVADSNLFDLSSNPSTPDDVELTPGLLKGYAGGLRALDGNDSVRGSADGEIVNGNAGKDFLYGRDGADFFLGGRDADAVYGENGDDTVNGNRGNDLVDGGMGNDAARGGQDDDLLVGAQGNDTLTGDFGRDVLIGGSDSDVFVLRTDAAADAAGGADIIADFDKFSDRIGLTDGVSEASLTFEPFVTSLRDDLKKGLTNAGMPESQADLFAPQLLSYLQSFPNTPSSLNALFESVFKKIGIGDSQQVQAIFQSYIRYSDIDPNGDGIVEGTAIKVNNTYLGVALNATAADLSGHFIGF